MTSLDSKQYIEQCFRKSYVFSRASQQTIDTLSECALLRQLEKDEVIFAEGEQAAEVFVLAEGRISFIMHDEHGKRYTLGLVADFSIFGDLELFTSQIRVSHAEAHCESVVIVIPKEIFINTIKKDPEVLFRIIRFYGALLERLSRFSLFRNVEKQLAYLIVDLCVRYGKPVKLEIEETKRQVTGMEIDVPLSQEFLGSLVGIPRQRVNTILKAWEKKAWIHVNYNHLVILDQKALKEFSII